MAHEITIRENGFAEIAFVGDTPWHGLGQPLNKESSIEEWRTAAGLDWSIQRGQVMFNSHAEGDAPTFMPYPGQQVLYRSDTGSELSIVSDRYKEVQPSQVLEFFRDLVDVAGYRLHTAGSLNGGRRIWALAETGKVADVGNNDTIAAYILLATSCDRGMATTARFTSVRVVCANTLAMANSNAPAKLSVPHNRTFDAEQAKRILGIQVGTFDKFIQASRDLAKKDMTEAKYKSFMENLLQMTRAAVRLGEEYDPEKIRAYKRITELWEGAAIGADLPGVRGTYWGAVNAVTEYIDHHKPARSQDARLNNAWFKGGDRLKTRALELALAA